MSDDTITYGPKQRTELTVEQLTNSQRKAFVDAGWSWRPCPITGDFGWWQWDKRLEGGRGAWVGEYTTEEVAKKVNANA